MRNLVRQRAKICHDLIGGWNPPVLSLELCRQFRPDNGLNPSCSRPVRQTGQRAWIRMATFPQPDVVPMRFSLSKTESFLGSGSIGIVHLCPQRRHLVCG